MMFLSYFLVQFLLPSLNRKLSTILGARFLLSNELWTSGTATTWQDQISWNSLEICSKTASKHYLGKIQSQTQIFWENLYPLPYSTRLDIYMEFQVSGVWNNEYLNFYANGVLIKTLQINLDDQNRPCTSNFIYESYAYMSVVSKIDTLRLTVRSYGTNQGLYFKNIVINQRTQYGINNIIPFFYDLKTCTTGSDLQFELYYCQCYSTKVFQNDHCKSECDQGYLYDPVTNQCYQKQNCDLCGGVNQILKCNPGTYQYLVSSSESDCLTRCPNDYYEDQVTMTCTDMCDHLQQNENNGCKLKLQIVPVDHYFFYKNTAGFFHFFFHNDIKQQVYSVPAKQQERAFTYHNGMFVAGSYETFQSQKVQIAVKAKLSQHKIRFRAIGHFVDFIPTRHNVYINDVLQPESTLQVALTNEETSDQDYITYYDYYWIRTELYPVSFNNIVFDIEQPLINGVYQGYFYIEDIHIFQFQCITNCRSCYTIDYCTPCLNPANKNPSDCTCLTGFIKQGDICIACPTYCSYCTIPGICDDCLASTKRINSPNCDTCPQQYYLQIDQDNCQECQLGCKICINKQTCNNCLLGYYKNVDNQCIIQCLDGYFNNNIDITNPICSLCSNNCLKCENIDTYCTACIETATLINNHCYTCNDGFYLSGATCLPCISNCQKCNNGLICIKCQETYFLQSSTGQCVSICDQNKYSNIITRTCEQCHPTCSACLNGTANDCVSCPRGSILNIQSQISGNCQQNCAASYFRIGDYCVKCWKGCFSCIDATPACLICAQKYFRYKENGLCYAQCPDGFYNNKIGFVCSVCNSICKTCYASTEANCSSCQPPLALYQGQCLTACPNEYGNVNAVCLQCTSNCQQCYGIQPNQCQTCSKGFYFLKNQCYIKCPTSFIGIRPQYVCKCVYDNCVACTSIQYFYNNHCYDVCPQGSFGYNGLCVKCNISCGTCFGEDENSCLSCLSPLILFKGNCVTECTGTTFQDLIKNECLYCNDSCFACNGPEDNNCIACYEPQLLTEDGNCVDQCSENEYIVLSEKKCFKCDPSCLTCFSGSNKSCLTCSNLFYLYQCVDSCPDGFKISTNQYSCEPNFEIVIDVCSYQCTTCELIPRFCKTCSGNRIPNPPNCDCENGYFDDGKNADCQQCVNKCSTCSIYADNCITCKGDRLLRQCVCPKFYYDDGISVNCIKCPDNCASCTESGCITCLTNRINQPDCICTDGYYEAFLPYCQECAKKCLTCSISDKLCTTCSDIRENPPICNCPNGYFENLNEECQQCNQTCIDCNISGCLTCFGNRVGPTEGLCTCANPGVSRLNAGSVFCTDCLLGVPYFGLNNDFTGFYYDFGGQVSIIWIDQQLDLCSHIFTLETLKMLGENPQCDINQNVLFGQNPTIKVGDLLQLKPSFLLLGCQSSFTNVLAMPLSIPLTIDTSSHLPIIKFKDLISPNVCTPISIEFEQILYNGNQKLKILEWVRQSDPNIQAILDMNTANNSDKIVFPIKTFQAGLKYQFKVTVQSFVNLINTLTIEFLPVAFSTILFEPNSDKNQFHRFESIAIPFTISYFNCIEQSPQNQLLFYSIKLQNTNQSLLHGSITEGLIDGYTTDIQLNFDSYFFNFTNPYTLVYTTILQRSDYKVETSGNFDIFIVSSTPIITIEGGNRMIGYYTNLSLNATIQDQDLSQEEAANINYKCYWECTDIVNGTNCQSQLDQSIVFDNKCQQTIKGKTFAAYKVFQFSVSIIKNTILYSTKISIQIIELDLPVLTVSGIDQSSVFNYYDEFIYKLVYPGVNPDLMGYAGAIIYNQVIQATFQFYYLDVKFKLLNYFTSLTQELGTKVRLRLSIYDPRFIMPSLNTQILIMNIPPQFCQLQFDQNISFIEFLDEIKLIVLDCYDENLPLLYSIQFYPNYTIYESDLINSNFYNYILIQPPQPNNTLVFNLPYLNNVSSYLVIIIQDSYGGITNLTTSINIKQYYNISENTLIDYQNRQITFNQRLIGYRIITERLSYIINMQILKENVFQELIFMDQNQSFLSNQTECLYHSLSIIVGQNSSLLQINESITIIQLQYRMSLAQQALQNLDYYQQNNIMTSSQNIEKNQFTQQLYSIANIFSQFIKYRVAFNRSATDIQDYLNLIINKLQDISIANEPLYKINTDSANLNFGYLTSKITQTLTGQSFIQNNDEQSNDVINYNSQTNFYKYSQTRYLDNPYYSTEGFPKNSSGYQAVDPKIQTDNQTSDFSLQQPMKFQFPNVKELAANTSLKCIAQINQNQWSADICKAVKENGNIVCQCKELNPTSLMESLDYVLDKAAQIYSLDTLLAFANFPFYKTIVFYFYLFITSTYLFMIYWGMKVDNIMFQKLQDELVETLKDDQNNNAQNGSESERDKIEKQILKRTIFKQASTRVMQIVNPNSLVTFENIQVSQKDQRNSESHSPRSQLQEIVGSSQCQLNSPHQMIHEDYPLMKLKQQPQQQTEDRSQEKDEKEENPQKISKLKAYLEYMKFFHQILQLVFKDDEKQPRALRATIIYTSIMGSLAVLFVFNQPNNLSLTLVLALLTAPLNKIYQILLEKLLTNKRKVIRAIGGGIMIIVAGFISYTMLAGLVLSGSIETANKWSYIFISTFSLDNLIYSPIQLVLQYLVHIGVIKFPILQQLLHKFLDEKGKDFLKQIFIKTGII